MAKPILTSISPNIDKTDVVLAIKILFKPWQWQKGNFNNSLQKKLAALLGQKHCWLFNAGRNALQIGLEAFELRPTDEVLCQAFTCVAVPNAIKWAGAKVVFVDTVKNGFNLSLKDLKKKITKNSKAIIVQHTFGNPDNLDQIKKICQKHQLILIEDCAHSLGVKYQGKPIGSFGDLTMLSFGRDKVISSVFGGAVLTKDKKLADKINQIYSNLPYPSKFWIFKQLLHPIITFTIKPVYFSIGKLLMFSYQKSGLLSWPVTKREKNQQPSMPIKKLPNALRSLALNQLSKLTQLNNQRQSIVKLYQQKFQGPTLEYRPLLRYPILVNNPQKLIRLAKKQRILLGDWYRPIISPKGAKSSYQSGSCPNAENVSSQVVNLPTLITKNQANKIIKLVNDHS